MVFFLLQYNIVYVFSITQIKFRIPAIILLKRIVILIILIINGRFFAFNCLIKILFTFNNKNGNSAKL